MPYWKPFPNPTERPFDPSKLAKVPPILKAEDSGRKFTIPENEEPQQEPAAISSKHDDTAPQKDATVHSEIKWLLLKLGDAMGLDVWVARNDRNKSVNGQSFSSLPRLRKTLPHQFDQDTTRTIELIDVLWLRGNAIQAAFEIESTTLIYAWPI